MLAQLCYLAMFVVIALLWLPLLTFPNLIHSYLDEYFVLELGVLLSKIGRSTARKSF